MNKFWKNLCAGTLALGLSATSIIPVSAMPQPAPAAPVAAGSATDAQLVQVVDRGDLRRLRRDRRLERRFDRAERRLDRRGDRYYYRGYRGYRGYRYARPGYRYYNGYYFPGAAFIAGAIIGGTVGSSARPRGNAHVEWCYNRYRSYRASDNTYQPNSGPRRQCNSPFD